ncbi:SIS domain-containing protein [Tranquillimonas alkanivorans]|uniref:Glutamine--fructose-6-phosphate transaminase n=1 Tax=Tranquillimonas alkanivorans TaxID=441119 RepID=A0A1I5WJX1_9RHOB|nr:SIS domain-containing protein [Tranquillimonas alkanivorans]SFQ19970.1 glutamine--fructose-6-phosphate transaminase [Tranquillimonas alkanivorans]
MTEPTMMRREIDEIPEAAARLCEDAAQADFARAAAKIVARDPAVILTIARGSSDHAATCLKYATEILTGRPVASLGPSVASIYGGALHLPHAVAVAISQSGRSHDLVAATEACAVGGAETVALTNSPDSPLGAAAGTAVDLCAGPEKAVAATKSYVNSVLSGLWLIAHWTDDVALKDALQAMPARFEAARTVDWGELCTDFARIDRLFVLGRGPGLGIVGEVALKAMELCGVQASAYSAAEVLHGPARVLTAGFPVLALGAVAEPGMDQTLEKLTSQGVRLIAEPGLAASAAETPVARLLDRLVQLVPLYSALEAAARTRGWDPDRPEFLRKETVTL